MRVLFACHRYYPVPGGSEWVAQHLAEGLAARGHEVTLITQQEPGTAARETRNGVDLIRIPTRPVAGVRFPAGYLRLLKRCDAEVFHVHGNRIWCADFYFPFARRFRWRQLVTGHGFYQYHIRPTAIDRLYFERYFPWVLGAFDYYVPDTVFERQELVGWGVPVEKLPIIPLGVDVAEFRAAHTDPAVVRAGWGVRAPLVAVYAGGLFENKRVDRLIEAIAPVRDQWALVQLGRDVPGNPYDAAHCRQLAERLGVELVVRGQVPRAEVIDSYHAADAIVLASEFEGYGVAIAEALPVGKPFVAWRRGAAPELAATGSGFAVDSVAAFTAALRELADPARRRAMGAAAASVADDWSSDAMLRRYLTLYERLASLGPRR